MASETGFGSVVPSTPNFQDFFDEQATGHNEETLWSGSVSHWHYAGQWLLVALFLAANMGTFSQRLAIDVVAVLVVRVVLGLIALALLVWIRLDRSNRKYIITNRRVIVESGIISKRSNDLQIHDIGQISLTVTGLWDLAGIGELEFTSKAMEHASVIFRSTPSAEEVLALVRSLQSSIPSTVNHPRTWIGI